MISTVNPQQAEISTLDALWALYQSQSKTQAQQRMVHESLTRAFDDLHAGKVRHNARNLFK